MYRHKIISCGCSFIAPDTIGGSGCGGGIQIFFLFLYENIMSSYNLCFHTEIRKKSILFG